VPIPELDFRVNSACGLRRGKTRFAFPAIVGLFRFKVLANLDYERYGDRAFQILPVIVIVDGGRINFLDLLSFPADGVSIFFLCMSHSFL
jgi:hypothetical protein